MNLRARNGFTLLELLLTMGLVSIIMTSIVGGLHIGRRAWESAKASEAIDEVEGATRAIANEIARSFPTAIQSSARPQQQMMAGFVGAPDAIRFIALSEGGAQWGGLILTEIAGENVGSGAEVAIWTSVYRPSSALTPERSSMVRTTVVKNVAAFQLSYYGEIDKGRFGWIDNWRQRQNFPKLVSVKLGANRLGRVIDATATVAVKMQ